MQKRKNLQLIVIGVLSFAILFMSIGFAAYSQVLNTKSSATASRNKWSVHFNPSSYQLGEGSVKESIKSISDNKMSYDVILEKPGDYYLFQIDVVNDGQANAILDGIEMSELPAGQEDYIKYTVSYEDQEYSQSQSNLNYAIPSATGVNRKVVMVRVAYEPDGDNATPLTEPISLSLSSSFNFSQAD